MSTQYLGNAYNSLKGAVCKNWHLVEFLLIIWHSVPPECPLTAAYCYYRIAQLALQLAVRTESSEHRGKGWCLCGLYDVIWLAPELWIKKGLDLLVSMLTSC